MKVKHEAFSPVIIAIESHQPDLFTLLITETMDR